LTARPWRHLSARGLRSQGVSGLDVRLAPIVGSIVERLARIVARPVAGAVAADVEGIAHLNRIGHTKGGRDGATGCKRLDLKRQAGIVARDPLDHSRGEVVGSLHKPRGGESAVRLNAD